MRTVAEHDRGASAFFPVQPHAKVENVGYRGRVDATQAGFERGHRPGRFGLSDDPTMFSGSAVIARVFWGVTDQQVKCKLSPKHSIDDAALGCVRQIGEASSGRCENHPKTTSTALRFYKHLLSYTRN